MLDSNRRMEELKAHGNPMNPLAASTNGELFRGVEKYGQKLLNAQIALARIELQDQLISEMLLTRRLIIGSALMIFGTSTLTFAMLSLLSRFIPFWLSATLLGLFFIFGGWAVCVMAWKRQKSFSEFQNDLRAKLF